MKKAVMILPALALVAAIIAAVVGVYSNYLKKPKEVYAMPEVMTFSDVTKAGGIMLKATVEPENAYDKTLDWTVEFKSPSSAWATGKNVTDYVTITPTSDGADTATLECLQAFGEQILLKVTSRQQTTVSATCILDYVRRVTEINCTLTTALRASHPGGPQGTIPDSVLYEKTFTKENANCRFTVEANTFNEPIIYGGSGYKTDWTITKTYGIGTVDPKTTERVYVINSEQRQLAAAGINWEKTELIKNDTYAENGFNFTFNKVGMLNFFGINESQYETLLNVLYTISKGPGSFSIIFEVTLETGEVVKQTNSFVLDVTQQLNVKEITLSKTAIKF